MSNLNAVGNARQSSHNAAPAGPARHTSNSPVSDWEQQLHVAGHEGSENIPLRTLRRDPPAQSVSPERGGQDHENLSGGASRLQSDAGRPSSQPGTTPATGPGSFQSHMAAQEPAGQGRPESPAAPASPAHSSGPAPGVPPAGPSAPQRQPIDAVHFQPSPSGLPHIVDAQNQTTQYIKTLYEKSPTFQNTLSAATNNGRDSLELSYDKIHTGQQGEYDARNRRVTVDPFHPRNADVRTMQGVATFEFNNAAKGQDMLKMSSFRDNGGYEREAKRRNAENPDAPPVTGGRIYAQEVEHQEWGNAKQAHQAMTEGVQQGLQARPVYSSKFEAPAGGQAPWADFPRYERDQWDIGHTQGYMKNYQNRINELGLGGPSSPAGPSSPVRPSSPTLSLGDLGPEA